MRLRRITLMAIYWVSRHTPCTRLARHRHVEGYLAVVLAGGFVEAGDGPRIRAQSGDVIVHSAYEAHQDGFETSGAIVLNLPLPRDVTAASGRVCDPEAIARVAERDPAEAAALVRTSLLPPRAPLNDWPDQLAAALNGETDIVLGDWARTAGIAPQSLSRGFRQTYGVSPQLYRLEQRARRALCCLQGWSGSLARLAAETGFADQPHLTRTVMKLTGLTPGRLRVQSVQSGRKAVG